MTDDTAGMTMVGMGRISQQLRSIKIAKAFEALAICLLGMVAPSHVLILGKQLTCSIQLGQVAKRTNVLATCSMPQSGRRRSESIALMTQNLVSF
jgi:hypothetical protein